MFMSSEPAQQFLDLSIGCTGGGGSLMAGESALMADFHQSRIGILGSCSNVPFAVRGECSPLKSFSPAADFGTLDHKPLGDPQPGHPRLRT